MTWPTNAPKACCRPPFAWPTMALKSRCHDDLPERGGGPARLRPERADDRQFRRRACGTQAPAAGTARTGGEERLEGIGPDVLSASNESGGAGACAAAADDSAAARRVDG